MAASSGRTCGRVASTARSCSRHRSANASAMPCSAQVKTATVWPGQPRAREASIARTARRSWSRTQMTPGCRAVEQARLTGAVVEAVIAWEYPVTFRTPWPAGVVIDFEQIAAHTVADAVPEAPGSADQVESGPRWWRATSRRCCWNAPAGADLLVVSSRGHGGFVGLCSGRSANIV